MKRHFLSIISLAVATMVATSCLADQPKETDPEPEPEPGPAPIAPDLSQFVGSQLDFEINWDDFDSTEIVETEAIVTNTASDEYSDFVENTSFPHVVKINYASTTASIENAIAGVSVSTSGAHIEVNSTVAGVEYVLSGTTTDGSLKIYSSADVKISLNGVSIASTKSAAINVQSNKNIYLVVADDTQNSLADAVTYNITDASEDQKSCIFGEGRMIISGNGSLEITANYNHAICSDKALRLRAGSNVTINKAPSDALHANDKIIIGGGLLTATVEGDAIDCEAGNIEIRGGRTKIAVTGGASKAVKAAGGVSVSGGQAILITQGNAYFNSTDQDIKSAAAIRCPGMVNISDAQMLIKSTGSAGKGINCDGALTINNSIVKVKATGQTYNYNSSKSASAKAITAEGNLTITSSTVWALALGGDDCEGIESKMTMTINSGEVKVSASDNGLNATVGISINGGNVYSFSANNDALDSNGTFTLNGGNVVLSGAAYPEGGVDCDQNTFKITGGTLFSIGGDTSQPTADQCTQNALVFNGHGSEKQLFTITDNENKQIASYVIPREYDPMAIIFSSPALISDKDFNIYAEGSYLNGETFCGLNTGGDYTPGSLTRQFTTSSTITTIAPSVIE